MAPESNGDARMNTHTAYQIGYKIASVAAIIVAIIAGVWAGIQGKKVENVQENVQQKDTELNQLKETDQQLKKQSLGSLEDGQKLCVVLGKGKTWRDGLVVPQDWNVRLCEDYMKRSGGTLYQLGCIKTSG